MSTPIRAKTSASFKMSVFKVISTIILFIVLYLFLLGSSAGMIAGSIFLAIKILSVSVSAVTIMLSLGLFLMSLMFFIFLVKFMFATTRDENPARVQIFEKDHPAVFALIKDIAAKTGTRAPKKVFLNYDVNARVFYNSGFWSLFLPVRKNLEIGLGLVNSVNTGEFTCVLAHEFGHFSQRSMALGSYIYTTNKVIYNLVNEHDGWDKALYNMSRAHSIIAILAILTSKLVWVVQPVMRLSYKLINLTYLRLSREMEFHADHIASLVGGKKNSISALRRIEICSAAFEQAKAELADIHRSNLEVKSIFDIHRFHIEDLARQLNCRTEDGLPLINDQVIAENAYTPRVIVKDQWSSHPSRKEREKRIGDGDEESFGASKELPWSLFENAEKVQEVMTKVFYRNELEEKPGAELLDAEAYKSRLDQQRAIWHVNPVYKGFYSNRGLSRLDEVLDNPGDTLQYKPLTFQDIYTERMASLVDTFDKNNRDLSVLQDIKNRELKVQSFEFDHKRYKRKDAGKAIDFLEKENQELEAEISTLDKQALLFNQDLANKSAKDMPEKYVQCIRRIFRTQDLHDKNQEFINALFKQQIKFYTKKSWSTDDISELNRELTRIESSFRNFLKELDMNEFQLISDEYKNLLTTFLADSKSMFKMVSFDERAFTTLHNLVHITNELLSRAYLVRLKELTEFQLELYENAGVNIGA